MAAREPANLAQSLDGLKPKDKPPSSARILHTWIAQAHGVPLHRSPSNDLEAEHRRWRSRCHAGGTRRIRWHVLGTRGLLRGQTGSDRSPFFMPMDLCKVNDHYVLTADLPGVDPVSIDVTADNGTFPLSARRSAHSEDAAQWLTNERFFGTYRRQLSLGDGVDASRIAATYDNGGRARLYRWTL
jgi:HSP20 family molecular chaperone IbpA